MSGAIAWFPTTHALHHALAAGGPLLRYVNGKPVLVGVVSYGPDWPCGTAGSVGGYMSVAKMNGWVQRQLARLRV